MLLGGPVMRRPPLLLAIAALVPVMQAARPASAKPLYVSPTGSDQVSYADNGPGSPWATVGRAAWGSADMAAPNPAEAAQAGDEVIVSAGTYATTQATDERYLPIYNPVNDGQPGMPITFRADGLVVLESPTAGEGEPVIGTYMRSHIVWDGFFIDEANVNTAPDTGPVVVWASDNVVIQNLEVAGIAADWVDNHNAIRIEAASQVTIRSNRLHGVTIQAGPHQNNSAIMLYGSSDVVIENNEIYDSGGGVFVKGSAGGMENVNVTLRYNFIHSTPAIGIGFLSTHGGLAHQNVIVSSGSAFKLTGFPNTPHDIDIVNNTIVGAGYGALFHNNDVTEYANVRFHNNVVASSLTSAQAQDSGALGDVDYQHNCYWQNTYVAQVGGADLDLATWQASHGQDDEAPASIQADPAFVDAASGDYHLGAASPCRTVGLDSLDLDGDGDTADVIPAGAYVTGDEVIGPTGGNGPGGGGPGSGGAGGAGPVTGTGSGSSASGAPSGGEGAGLGSGGAGSAEDGGADGGCGCRAASDRGRGDAWLALVAFALWVAKRSRLRRA